MANKVWVFDLDDTLMNTAKIYTRQLEEACHLIMEQLGDCSPTLSQLKQRQLKIDSSLRTKINPITKKPYYYAMERFPLSFVKTYEYFCKELNLEPEYIVEQELYKIGMKTYLPIKEYQKKIKKETKIILSFLKEQGDILILLTKGDTRVQKRKLKALGREGLLKYFTKCKIVADKKQKVFKRLKKGFSGKKFYSVGNEFHSDIEPAIKEGYFGIYIPTVHVPWDKGKMKKTEEERDKKNSNRYSGLLEIRDKYNYL